MLLTSAYGLHLNSVRVISQFKKSNCNTGKGQFVSKGHHLWSPSAALACRKGGQPLNLPHLLVPPHEHGQVCLCDALPWLGTGLGLGNEREEYFSSYGGNSLSSSIHGFSPFMVSLHSIQKGLAEARKAQGRAATSHLGKRGWKLFLAHLSVFPFYGFVAGEGKSSSLQVNNNRENTWKQWPEQIKKALHGTA